MFFGNLSNPPPVGSVACALPSTAFNLTTTNTYVTVSASGSVAGPWAAPRLARGMENSKPLPGDTGHSSPQRGTAIPMRSWTWGRGPGGKWSDSERCVGHCHVRLLVALRQREPGAGSGTVILLALPRRLY